MLCSKEIASPGVSLTVLSAPTHEFYVMIEKQRPYSILGHALGLLEGSSGSEQTPCPIFQNFQLSSILLFSVLYRNCEAAYSLNREYILIAFCYSCLFLFLLMSVLRQHSYLQFRLALLSLYSPSYLVMSLHSDLVAIIL